MFKPSRLPNIETLNKTKVCTQNIPGISRIKWETATKPSVWIADAIALTAIFACK